MSTDAWQGTGVTTEDLLKACNNLKRKYGFEGNPPRGDYFRDMYLQRPVFDGLPVYDNPYLTETETYEEEVLRTRYERWLQPFASFHEFTTTPFEPWVKVKTVTKSREVPMKKAMVTPQGIFIHPAIRSDLANILKGATI